MDLLFTKGKGKVPPNLDIKKDPRGTVKVEPYLERGEMGEAVLRGTVADSCISRWNPRDTYSMLTRTPNQVLNRPRIA